MIPTTQVYFNILKIHVIHHINRLVKKSHIITSKKKKTFHKIEYPFIIKKKIIMAAQCD